MSDDAYIRSLEDDNERLRLKIQDMQIPKGYAALKLDDETNKLVVSFSAEALHDIAFEFGIDAKSTIMDAVIGSVRVELDKILEKKGIV